MARNTKKGLIMSEEYTVKFMLPDDMDEVLELEQAIYAVPWTAEQFRELMSRIYVHGYVLRTGGRLIGYAMFEGLKTRMHILNWTTNPAWEDCGALEFLMGFLKSKLVGNRKKLTAICSERHLKTQLQLRDHGFLAVEIIPDAFADDDADGIYFLFDSERQSEFLPHYHNRIERIMEGSKSGSLLPDGRG